MSNKYLTGCLVFTVFVVAIVLAIFHFKENRMNVYLGGLHGHTTFSDGYSSLQHFETQLIKRSGYDFISLTEHSGMLDMAEFDLIKGFSRRFTTGTPVVLYGQEYGHYHKFNSVAVQNYPKLIRRKSVPTHRDLFELLRRDMRIEQIGSTVFVELNHPQKFLNDYGFTAQFHQDEGVFVEMLDPLVQLINLDRAGLDSDKTRYSPPPKIGVMHQFVELMVTENWLQYLMMGMHLTAKIDSAYHSRYFGQLYSVRNGVWVRGNLNRAKLINALRSRHIYVTNDLNMRVTAKVNGSYLPGDILPISGHRQFTVDIEVIDSDEPDAEYHIEVIKGYPGWSRYRNPYAHLEKPDVKHQTAKPAQNRLMLTLPVESKKGAEKTFFIVKVVQTSTDPVNQSPVNVAILAPVWFE